MNKTKIYILFGLGFLVFIGLLILLAILNIISILTFIIVMGIIIVIPSLIGIMIYFIKKAKEDRDEKYDLLKRKRELDSDTIVEWAKEYMRKNYITEIEIKNKRTFQFGDIHERTIILNLTVRGLTDYKYYDIIVNAFDKNMHSIVPGINDIDFIIKLAEHLSLAPIYRPKRIIKRIQPEGIQTTVEEELQQPNVKEEVIQHEDKQK